MTSESIREISSAIRDLTHEIREIKKILQENFTPYSIQEPIIHAGDPFSSITPSYQKDSDSTLSEAK